SNMLTSIGLRQIDWPGAANHDFLISSTDPNDQPRTKIPTRLRLAAFPRALGAAAPFRLRGRDRSGASSEKGSERGPSEDSLTCTSECSAGLMAIRSLPNGS